MQRTNFLWHPIVKLTRRSRLEGVGGAGTHQPNGRKCLPRGTIKVGRFIQQIAKQ